MRPVIKPNSRPPNKTLNQKVTQLSSYQIPPIAVSETLPFIFMIFPLKCHKGGIFHKPLPWVRCGMQTRWSKSAELSISAVTACWDASLLHVMSTSLNLPSESLLSLLLQVQLCPAVLLAATVAADDFTSILKKTHPGPEISTHYFLWFCCTNQCT